MSNHKSKLTGVAAAPGITVAKAYLYSKEIASINSEVIENIDEAKNDLLVSLEKSRKELRKVFSLAFDKLGEKRAAIFEAQIMILDDQILIGNIMKRIEDEKIHPEFIVFNEITKYQNIMASSTEPYMKERSQDIDDIKNRIIRNLKKKKWKSKIDEEVIIVTNSITPADTMLFSKANVKGYITNFGGLTSHAAILARALNIPAVVGIHGATMVIEDGDVLIIDGFHGEVIINPSDEVLTEYKNKIIDLQAYDEDLIKLRNEPAVTKDGREIEITGNLDFTDEIEMIIQNGANGIGLVRTEQLFNGLDHFPDEFEQYIVYKKLAEKIYPNQITIRAFDIGGDKVLPIDVKEPNPFLGWRGVRFLLDNLELFESQIKSVLRASIHKNVKLMIPMISKITEVREVNRIIVKCKNELDERRINYDKHIQVGIMVEVPSAAVMVEEFSREVDFISIGTNDLIMYLLAVDRGNEIVSDLYSEFHPSVIRTISHIITQAKKNKTKVSLCGEMAADVLAIPLLVGLGLDSISISASAIPYTKKIVRALKYVELKKLANKSLKLLTADEIRDLLQNFFNDKFQNEKENILVN